MARPTYWAPLGIYDDPTPGDPGVVETAADDYAAVATAIHDAKANIDAVFNTSEMRSDAVDALRETGLEVARRIGKAHARYQGVSTALSGYVEPLRTAQRDADALLDQATNAQNDQAHARDKVDHWQSEWLKASAAGDDQAAIDEAKRWHDFWQRALDSSVASQSDAAKSLAAIMQARDAAAETAIALIEQVENSGGLNDDFWDDLDQFFDENPWIDDALAIAGAIAGVLAIIALFVPGLNLIVGIIGAIVAVATVLNAVGQAAVGRKSWGEAIFEIVMAVVPFGAGKVLGHFSEAAVGAVKSTAVVSVMKSAAGSGVSGVTRVVAAEKVGQVLETSLLGRFPGGPIVEINALAKMAMTSGETSPAIFAAQQNAYRWIATELGAEAVARWTETGHAIAENAAEGSGEPEERTDFGARNMNW
ncbi:hypothetical protein [Schumannella sp. 10F1B-5-1]|uniref:hypothetical protein n=1 Tax=Schumannella sp. 10F1B-5-1 TaxID=2590780 RepID=UPI0011321F18|nr:hypothetical protein [Schumannella sp. 10F1B-5-1]TPW71641.1 hypothetical protein FJ658_09820 [Schumannella sp. 10F1B-5-1]